MPGYHIDDQKPGVKKCGHQGGKVLVSENEQIQRLNAARFQLDIMGVPGIIVARTDAEAASLAISPEVILVRTAGSRFWVSKREISCCGRQFVTSMWSAHTLLLVAAIGALLVCVGLLGRLVSSGNCTHTPFGL